MHILSKKNSWAQFETSVDSSNCNQIIAGLLFICFTTCLWVMFSMSSAVCAFWRSLGSNFVNHCNNIYTWEHLKSQFVYCFW
jgi:hypothetical protein